MADFFNEGYTRCGIFCKRTGTWHIKGSKGQPDATFKHGWLQDTPLVADIFNEGQYRCIVVNQEDGNWYCKAPGKQSWTGGWNGVGDKNNPKNCDIVFNHGQPGDIPLAHNIFGDGVRAIQYRREGKWHVKGLGYKNWFDSPGNHIFSHGVPGNKQCTPFISNILGDGMRAILWHNEDGNWSCKQPGLLDWDKCKNNVTFQNGLPSDQPFIADIVGDGPRACVFRKELGKIYVKSRGPASWNDGWGTFGNCVNMTISCRFPGDDPATNFSHDKAFVYTPSPLTPSMGHIHPVIYRGCKQAFYVQKQSGLKNPSPFNPYKVNKMMGGTTDITNVLESGVIQFQFGKVGDIPMFADFFNEGLCRAGVFRPSDGTWHVKGIDGMASPGTNVIGADISFKFDCVDYAYTGDMNNTGFYPFVGDVLNEGRNRCILYSFSDGMWYVKHASPYDWSHGVNAGEQNVTFQCGGKGQFPMLGNVFSDGIRACVWKASNGEWSIKSLGGQSWGAIPTTSPAGTVGCDVMCQNGLPQDVPLIGNVFGDGTRMCVYRESQEYVGYTGKIGLTGLDAVNQQIVDGVHSGSLGCYWHCKAYGPNDWGKTTAPTMASTGITLSGFSDVSFFNGNVGDCPIISNVLGNGPRAINFTPSQKQWRAKSVGPYYWGSKFGSYDRNPDDHTINMCNDLKVEPGSHTGLYMNRVKTPFWPLNFRPVQPDGGDYVSFVDMSTFIWYINWNPKRV